MPRRRINVGENHSPASCPASPKKSKSKVKLSNTQLALLGLVFLTALDHFLLTFRNFNGEDNNSRKLAPECWLTNHNLDATDVTLEEIANEMECSTRLTDFEKETLRSTVQKLRDLEANIRKEQEALAAQPATLRPIQYKSPYCYYFVVGDIHEERTDYRGYFYDVLVSTYLLQQLGSTADVVLFAQLAHDSKIDQLPPMETKALSDLNIQVILLPKPATPEQARDILDFATVRGLQLTKHRRAIYLINDAMPLANMDYIFHLSDPEHRESPTILKPNVILASRGEPCTTAMFMIQPQEGDWENANAMIQKQLSLVKQGQGRDAINGWGYNFRREHEEWRGTVKGGSDWRFQGGFSDQGFLYYWTKYVKRHVSIVIQDEIENWIPGTALTADGKPKPTLETTLKDEPLKKYSRATPLAYQFECDTPKVLEKDIKHQPKQCLVPYRDYVHMFGSRQPWLAYNPQARMARTNSKDLHAGSSLWWTTLKELNLLLKLNIEDFFEGKKSGDDVKEEQQ